MSLSFFTARNLVLFADLSVFLFVSLHALADEDKHLAVGRAALVVGYNVQFVQKFAVNADRITLDSHIITIK